MKKSKLSRAIWTPWSWRRGDATSLPQRIAATFCQCLNLKLHRYTLWQSTPPPHSITCGGRDVEHSSVRELPVLVDARCRSFDCAFDCVSSVTLCCLYMTPTSKIRRQTVYIIIITVFVPVNGEHTTSYERNHASKIVAPTTPYGDFRMYVMRFKCFRVCSLTLHEVGSEITEAKSSKLCRLSMLVILRV
jgi:hypothetical protein